MLCPTTQIQQNYVMCLEGFFQLKVVVMETLCVVLSCCLLCCFCIVFVCCVVFVLYLFVELFVLYLFVVLLSDKSKISKSVGNLFQNFKQHTKIMDNPIHTKLFLNFWSAR